MNQKLNVQNKLVSNKVLIKLIQNRKKIELFNSVHIFIIL